MNKQLLFVFSLLIVFIAATSYGQRELGVSTGEYGALNNMFLNPANISGSHEKVEVNLFSLNLAVDNNLGTLPNLSNIGNSSVFNVSGTKPFSMLAPVADVRLPAVMISLNDKLKQSFAFSIRARGFDQLNHFDPNLFTTATSGDHTSSVNYDYQSNNFNWTLHAWSETGITYALQLLDNGPHNIKAGVTLKYLGGITYLSVKGKNLDVSYTSGSDTFYANHSDLEFASNAISSTSAVNNGIQTSDVLRSLFDSKAGSGFGMDIGVTYTYQIGSEDGKDNIDGHRLKGSIAVTDIGAINYKGSNNFVVNVAGNGYLTGTGLATNINNWNDFRNYMVTQGFTADTGAKATKLYMPTALVVGGDYQVYQRFFVNATYIANLANRQNLGNSYYNQFTLTPRYDSKLVSVGLPITYSSLANDIKVGFGFRIAGFFLGSDDMLALFSSNQRGFNFYFGGFIPIYKKAAKDQFGTAE